MLNQVERGENGKDGLERLATRAKGQWRGGQSNL